MPGLLSGEPRYHPKTGRPIIENPDGSMSTERSITVEVDDLNGGKPTNIPTIWDGQELDEDSAIDRAIKSGQPFPSFNTIDEAVGAAKARSRSLSLPEPDMPSPDDDGPAANVAPDEQAQYDEFVDKALRVIYDPKSFPDILQGLQGGGDPVAGLANTAALAIMRVEDSAKREGVEVSPDVLFHAGLEIMGDLAETAGKAAIHEFSDEEIEQATYKALDIYRQSRPRNIDQEAARAEFDVARQADEAGQLDELLPALRDPPMQAGGSAGLIRNPDEGM